MDENPTRETDNFLKSKTGQEGLIGSLLFRNEVGTTIRGHKTTGWFLWLLWAGEAAFVIGMATALPTGRASEPFCEDCGDWCEEINSSQVFASGAADPLAEAIRNDDAGMIRAAPGKYDADGKSTVHLSIHRCPTCGLAFGTVSRQIPNGKETKKVVVVNQVCISPATADAILGIPLPSDFAEVEPDGEPVEEQAPPPQAEAPVE